MKIETFIESLEYDIEHGKAAFAGNMIHIKTDNLSFCEWIRLFSAWMEWLEGDCEENHIRYVEDKNEK